MGKGKDNTKLAYTKEDLKLVVIFGQKDDPNGEVMCDDQLSCSSGPGQPHACFSGFSGFWQDNAPKILAEITRMSAQQRKVQGEKLFQPMGDGSADPCPSMKFCHMNIPGNGLSF